ncbi:helix-turn-helix domain-containing protein [Streptomyces sp. NRRL F-5630]|uniref:helix-turn-helix domain-containing protein n=1 Tax=unclassified Streptomyces TaxID=2593676 RepID=UPI00055BB64B|nr:XRE family transcriptional regulator [Streptomyces sp. NRRL F-5630]
MPRWKALPEGLDPQIREFTGQLRRLVDRAGLSVAALADRTGYSRTSWERYLGGRLLAPKGAVIALAEVTGAPPHHLTTMWELAERAWSRAESRHDLTMEAVRVSQARAALDERPAPARAATATYPKPVREEPVRDAPVPAREVPGPVRGAPVPGEGAPVPRRGARSGARPPRRPPKGPPSRGRRRATLLLAGVTGALVVLGAILFVPRLLDDHDTNGRAAPRSSASVRAAEPPKGVRCAGAGCAGRDPEAMGCGGELARTTDRAAVGTRLVEVRYSEVCGAAWARITRAGPGDTVTARAGRRAQRATVEDTGDAYTRMLPVSGPGRTRACAEVGTGEKGCVGNTGADAAKSRTAGPVASGAGTAKGTGTG